MVLLRVSEIDIPLTVEVDWACSDGHSSYNNIVLNQHTYVMAR